MLALHVRYLVEKDRHDLLVSFAEHHKLVRGNDQS